MSATTPAHLDLIAAVDYLREAAERLRDARAAVIDKRYDRLLGSFTELQAAAQFVVDETDRIHGSEPWPTKYRAPYAAIVKLRELLGRQYGLRALANRSALPSTPSDKP